MNEIFSQLQNPATIAIILAGLAALRGIGELLEAIGKKIEGRDPFERAGITIAKVVAGLGRFLGYFGIGNKQRK